MVNTECFKLGGLALSLEFLTSNFLDSSNGIASFFQMFCGIINTTRNDFTFLYIGGLWIPSSRLQEP